MRVAYFCFSMSGYRFWLGLVRPRTIALVLTLDTSYVGLIADIEMIRRRL